MMASKRGQEECESIPEDPTKTLQDMASAVREAGDAALLLQVFISSSSALLVWLLRSTCRHESECICDKSVDFEETGT